MFNINIQSVLSIDNKKYVLAENVEKYTEFDKSIKKVLEFKNYKHITNETILKSAYIPTYKRQCTSYDKYTNTH